MTARAKEASRREGATVTRRPNLTIVPTLYDRSDTEAGSSDFPRFGDGDVRIVVTGARQYFLHSSVLKDISPTLRHLLTPQNADKLNKNERRAGFRVVYRLQVVDDPTSDPAAVEPDYIIEPFFNDKHGEPQYVIPVVWEVETGRSLPSHVMAYEAVLGAFYNRSIEFGDFETDSMINILTNAMQVLKVAEYLKCARIITKPIESTLLSTGQLLQQSIANNPAAWLDFGYRVRSRTIFREALIHATGKYNTSEMQEALETMKKPIAQVVIRKGKALQEAMKKACVNMMVWYPGCIQKQSTVGRADTDKIGRAAFANDIFSWIALVVLRQWLSGNVGTDQTHHAPDMGKEFVDVVMAGGDKYLNKKEMDPFHAYFPMTGKGKSVLETNLKLFKEEVKKFVKDFQHNASQLDVRRFPVKHFTCTLVNHTKDYPWDTGYNTGILVETRDEAAASRFLDEVEDVSMTEEDNDDDTEDDCY